VDWNYWISRNADWWLATAVSLQTTHPIFKGQTFLALIYPRFNYRKFCPETSITRYQPTLCNISGREDLICTASEVGNHEKKMCDTSRLNKITIWPKCCGEERVKASQHYVAFEYPFFYYVVKEHCYGTLVLLLVTTGFRWILFVKYQFI